MKKKDNYHPCTYILINALLEIKKHHKDPVMAALARKAIFDWDSARANTDKGITNVPVN